MKKRLLSIVIASMGMLLTVGCKKGEDSSKPSGSTNPSISQTTDTGSQGSKPTTSQTTDTGSQSSPKGNVLPELNLSDWVKTTSGLVDGKYIIGANKADTLMIMSNHKYGSDGNDITDVTKVNNLTAVAYAKGAAVSDYSYSVKISTDADNSKSVSIQNTYNAGPSPLENKYLNNGGPNGTKSANKFTWSDTEVKWKVEDVADGIKLSQVDAESHTYIMALNKNSGQNMFGSYFSSSGMIQNLLFYKVG